MMNSFKVIEIDKRTKVYIKVIKRQIDFIAESDLIELFRNSSVKTFAGTVSPGTANF